MEVYKERRWQSARILRFSAETDTIVFECKGQILQWEYTKNKPKFRTKLYFQLPSLVKPRGVGGVPLCVKADPVLTPNTIAPFLTKEAPVAEGLELIAEDAF